MRILSAGLAILFLPVAMAASTVSEEPRPNVLIIISDDQGVGDFGFMGNSVVQTPNLDRLAEESAVFTNFVVAAACSPTRSALMTGRDHLATGVWGVGPRNNLLRDEVLMPAFFKAAGYHTGYFGKRDGVYLLEQEVWHRGCDEAALTTTYQHHNPLRLTHLGSKQMEGWTCDIDVDQSLDFISRMQGHPWWCTTAFIIPHLPWETDDSYMQPFKDAGLSPALAACYGSIAQMDEALGRLLDGIERAGESENTIIVFMSDNGPSEREMSEADWAIRNPEGLRGFKSSAWENGIRSPLLVRWPGRIPPGERPQFAAVEDILPTLLDLAGISPDICPHHLPFDGISLRAVLENPDAMLPDRGVFRIVIAGRGGVGGSAGVINEPDSLPMHAQHTAWRGPRFKYHSFADGSSALYDLKSDPGEAEDVSHLHPEVAASYASQAHAHYDKILQSGRPFRMPLVKVGPTGRGYNVVNGTGATRISGDLQTRGVFHLVGFGSAVDVATYEVDVLEPGSYIISLVGESLGPPAGWTLTLQDEVEHRGKPAGQDEVVFGPITLDSARFRFNISTEDILKPNSVRTLHQIVFSRPKPDQKSIRNISMDRR